MKASKARRQRKIRTTQHTISQRRKRENAMHVADDTATHISKSGTPLKKPRKKGTKAYQDAYREAMRELGYVPNGKGGWRRFVQRKQESTLSKESV